MKRNDVLKAIQMTPQYTTKSYKQITMEVGNDIASLRNKLKTLQSSNRIHIRGKGDYTEEQLIAMIDFYEQHHQLLISTDILNQDVKQNILLQADIDTILNLCQTDKSFNEVCKQNKFWQLLIARDFTWYPDDEPDSKTIYKKLLDFFTEHAETILIEYHQKLNHNKIKQLRNILRDYMNEYAMIDLTEDEDYELQNKLEWELIYKLLDVLPILNTKKVKWDNMPLPSGYRRMNEVGEFSYMRELVSRMHNDQIDRF